MSNWTSFRDDVAALAKDHPKKVGAVFVLGIVLARLVPWLWGFIF